MRGIKMSDTNNNSNNNGQGNTNNNTSGDGTTNNNNQATSPTAEQIKEMITKAVEDARKAEKDKLYDKIKNLEADVKVLQTDKGDIAKELNIAKEDLKKLTNNNTTPAGADATPAGTNPAVTNPANPPVTDSPKMQELEGTVTGLANIVKELNEQLKKRDLDNKKAQEEEVKSYRAGIITKNAIPEKLAKLIPSTTKQDVDEAVDSLIQEFAGMLKQVPSAGQEDKSHSGSLLTGNTRPKVSNPANPGFANLNISANDISQMTNEDFKKFREDNQGMFSGGMSFGFQRMTQRK